MIAAAVATVGVALLVWAATSGLFPPWLTLAASLGLGVVCAESE